MSLQYVIDGYNIIHHPAFTPASNKKIRSVRFALLELIQRKKLSGNSKNKVLVIFDGYPKLDENLEKANAEGVFEVVFSREESADERIKKIIERLPNHKNTIVVSDDKEIIFFARSVKARPLGVEEFLYAKEKKFVTMFKVLKPELTYSQMHEINQELRKIWLEP